MSKTSPARCALLSTAAALATASGCGSAATESASVTDAGAAAAAPPAADVRMAAMEPSAPVVPPAPVTPPGATPRPETPMPVSAPDPQPASAPAGRNRLGEETSPYLLQHKSNPVHWWPWGPEAFAAAREANKPIFLSVGYSTCYWCHVMERESFENEEIARLMNELFINIKVDREERPDVDDIYMMGVNVLNRGQGGWPMSVFLEPHTLKPFLAGTYFPPTDRGGRPGFPTVLRQVDQFWRTQHQELLEQANNVADVVARELAQRRAPVPVDEAQVERGVALLLSSYDREHGGFGRRMKFPMPSNLDFLAAAAPDEAAARDAVVKTLDRMATGGVYDQVGGGFHRYSTDVRWVVPHFEKMLYDNAQLASTYAAAYERTGDAYYAEIVRETLDYVLREMTDANGGFYRAQDAEVNHREGENYVWTAAEVRAVLEAAGLGADVDFALAVYGFDEGTNFQDPHHPEDGPKNVIRLVGRPDVAAETMGMPRDELESRLDRVNAALLAARMERDQPGTDDKIITGWNGLMIAGMADGGRALGEERFVEAAATAARFILTTMREPDSAAGLRRTYREGRAKIPAFLEDYAYLVHGLLALHRANADPAVLEAAAALTAEARALFWDESVGGYFDTRENQSDLFVRVKTTYDGATPSGNGVMLENLLDLHERTGDEAYLDDALATLRSMSAVLAERPTASVVTLRGLARIARDHPDRLRREPAGTREWDVSAAEGRVLMVHVRPSVGEVVLAPDATETFGLEVRMASSFHINARRPGLEYLIPLEVQAVGCDGIVIAVDYPEGEPFAGPDGTMWVHTGRVVLPVRVTRVGAITDECKLTITYQVCDGKRRLRPQTEVIDVRFVVGESRESG